MNFSKKLTPPAGTPQHEGKYDLRLGFLISFQEE